MSLIARVAPAIITSRRRPPIIAPRATVAPPGQPGGSFGLVGFQTWVEIDGIRYGAMPDLQGPIGGHQGYTNIVTTGDDVVSTIGDLQDALAAAPPGRVVFAPETASFDLSTTQINVPAGVTLASNRGTALGDGSISAGALFFSNTRGQDRHLIRPIGNDIRVTGIRVKGPDAHAAEEQNPGTEGETEGISQDVGSNLEVDNCEIYNFITAGVDLNDNDSDGHHGHHNYFHHCWGARRGYGFVMDQCGGVFEYNLFIAMRHATAHTGRNPVSNPGNAGSGDYTTRENVYLNQMIGVQWDMHSSPQDPGSGALGGNDGGRCGILRCINNYTNIHQSTSGTVHKYAQLRGTPHALGSEYTHNWINHPINWNISAIFALIEEQYDCAVQGTCPVYNRNLWAGENQVVRGPGT